MEAQRAGKGDFFVDTRIRLALPFDLRPTRIITAADFLHVCYFCTFCPGRDPLLIPGLFMLQLGLCCQSCGSTAWPGLCGLMLGVSESLF